MEKSHYQWQNRTLLLRCHVQPGAKRSELAGLHGDRLKIRVKAPPVEGKANDELVKFLARLFNVTKSDIEVRRGLTDRRKTVAIRQPQTFPPEVMVDSPGAAP